MSGSRATGSGVCGTFARDIGFAGLAFLLVTLSCTGELGVDLTILHVNDLHARLLPDSQGRGGFAHVATVLERE